MDETTHKLTSNATKVVATMPDQASGIGIVKLFSALLLYASLVSLVPKKIRKTRNKQKNSQSRRR